MGKDLLYPGRILSLHREAAERLLEKGSGDAALLYLCLAAERDPGKLGWDADRLETAHRTLLELRLADPGQSIRPAPPEKPVPDTPPEYTSRDVTMALKNGSGFALLVPEVEKLLGKPLSPADLKTLLLLHDYLSLPPEVILVLVGWCVEQAEKRYGKGRKPTLTQIKREGLRWQQAGVDSLDAADAHLRRLVKLSSRGAQIMTILGIRDREPVEREREYLSAWIEMGVDDEVLSLAYERTVFQTGKFRWGYMNGILTSWQKQGLKTAEDIHKAEDKRKSVQAPRSAHKIPEETAISSDDIDRMIRAAQWAAKKEGT